ncbi:S8 family serine peptidase [Arcanobacterium haemolyticum]|nr:S8 family serine peptidase [Arcanobacterium haemolyticum]
MTHYRKHIRGLFACTAAAAVTFGATLPAFAADASDQSESTQLSGPSLDELKEAAQTNNTGKWFVQLSADPVIKQGAERAAKAEIAQQQEEFEKEITDSDANVEVKENFSELWNGVTVEADAKDLDKIVAAKNVVAVYPVLEVQRPVDVKGNTSDPQMLTATAITGADTVQNDLGITGKGIKVGIIDTGIDLDNPLFGGTGVSNTTRFPNDKVVAGYDFVGDAFNANTSADNYDPVPHPDSNPDDCKTAGHGSHVAGIVAGNGKLGSRDFKGVAPDALLGAYRVFGCEGSTDTSVMVQAMEQAAKDGMDVVNMSIGAPTATWPNYPTAVAANNLVDAGVVVTVSQGNSGDSGIFYGSAPAVASKVIAVGSVDNTAVMQNALKIGDKTYGYSAASNAPVPPMSGTFPLATYTDEQITGAVDLDGEPFTGKAVLVQRGTSTFYDKARAAQKDGAAALVIFNNAPGVINASVAGDEEITIPVVTLTQEQGAEVLAALRALGEGETLNLEWTSDYASAPDANGGLISDFSSWGVGANLTLKPNVVAPGGNIFSAAPLDGGDGSGFVSMSGTSMAAPHVAGAAALLLAANPSLKPGDVPAILENTAKPIAYSADNQDVAAQVWRQGAGLINIPAAIAEATSGAATLGTGAQPSTVTPGIVNLYDGDTIETTQVTITNNRATAQTYTLGVNSTGALNAPGLNADAAYRVPADLTSSVTFKQNGTPVTSVTVAPYSTATLDVTVTEPAADISGEEIEKGSFYGGWLTFTADNNTKSVPFFGLKGDYETDRAFLYSYWTYGERYPGAEDQLRELGIDPDAYIPNADLAYYTECTKFLEDQCVQEKPGISTADDGHLYKMEAGNGTVALDYPTTFVALENPAKKLTITVYTVNADGTLGEPLSETPVYSKDGVGVGGNAWSWNGKYTAADGTSVDAPNGRYAFKVDITKGVGEANTGNDADNYESWTSAPFIVRNVEVTPQAPVYSDGKVTIPDVDGVTYLVNGEVVTGEITLAEGESVTITAQPESEAYVFAADAAKEWNFENKAEEPSTPAADPAFANTEAVEAELARLGNPVIPEVTVTQGDTFVAPFEGLTPSADAKVYTYSDAAYATTAAADAEGKLSVALSSANLTVGTHYAVATSVSGNPAPSSFVKINVLEPTTPATAEPSSEPTIETPAPSASAEAKVKKLKKKALAFTGASALGGIVLVAGLTIGGTILVRRREQA